MLVSQRRSSCRRGGSERTERRNERGTACVANDSPRETAGPPMTTHRLWHSAWMGKVDAWMGGWIDGSMDRRREASKTRGRDFYTFHRVEYPVERAIKLRARVFPRNN